MWLGGVQGTLHTCTYPMSGVGEAMVWEGRMVRIPIPVLPTIEAMYGKNWKHPVPNWRWDIDPFLTSYCKY